jgi:predicted hydrocarbon binding protein
MKTAEQMNRRELLQQTCGMGLCSCLALALPNRVSAGEPPATPKPIEQWQIDFMRSRLENLLEIIATTLDEPTRAKLLGRLGRECGKQVVKGFEGNPEGYWAHIKTLWLDRVEYDKDKGIIRLVEKERTQCNCPLAALIKVPTTLCLCSLGTQEAIYESLFNRPVKVRLEESILHGAKRCSFTIMLGPQVDSTASAKGTA